MLKKIIKTFIYLNLVIILLVFTAWSVRHVLLGGKKLIPFDNLIISFASIPENIERVFRGINSDIGSNEIRFPNLKGFVHTTNDLNLDGYLLVSRYDGELKKSLVEIYDLKKRKVIHQYTPDFNEIIKKSPKTKNLSNLNNNFNAKRYIMRHPLILRDGSLIFNSSESSLVRADKCSNIIWINDNLFHHSKEIDDDNNVYVPLTDNKDIESYNNLRQDSISVLSLKGKLLNKYNVINVLRDNNIEPFAAYSGNDPIHLNDIQPALKDTKYWKKGDLFLSIRSLSLVALYRPSNNKIIWHSFGPWIYQHDVDILNDKEILIFNNNLDSDKKLVNGNNNIIKYNFEENKYTYPFKVFFEKNDIRTRTEGRSEIILENYLLIEETNHGRIIVLNNLGEVIFGYFNKYNNISYPLGWSRFLDKNNYKEIIENITNNECN